MGIFTNRATQRALQEMERTQSELDALKKTHDERIGHYRKVQETLVNKIDILTGLETESKNVGNEYQDYATAVQAISEKYCGTAKWGILQTGAIIDLRAAFILGDGLKVSHTTDTKEEAARELQFAEDFLAYNGLDSEMAQEIVKEAEIEGKAAIKIIYDEDEYREWPGMVTARFISWSSKKYEVVADANDYLWYKQLKWKPVGQEKEETLDEPVFVYKKFGGRLNDPNSAQPRIMKCLTQVDRLDKALYDLRRIDYLFASPTPDFEVEDMATCQNLLDQIENLNWKIGKAIVHTGKFTLVGPPAEGVANLIAEIELNVKMVSGTTGVPIHYLGLLDLLKNRATGDNTRELVMAATTKERAIWIGAFEELLTKAMEMYNVSSGEGQKSTRLDPTRIKVDIPLISQEHYDHIEKVYIPAAIAGIVSKEFVAEQIPGIDIEAEAKRREEADAKAAEQAKADLEMTKAEMNIRNMGND